MSILKLSQMFMMCAVSVINIGEEPVVMSPAPHGDCTNSVYCCRYNNKSLGGDIRFLLYTRSASKGLGVELPYNDAVGIKQRLIRAQADPANPTAVFIHGFLEKMPGPSGSEIRDAYLDSGNYNVILVDWSPMSAMPWYVTAVRNTRLVGRVLARFLLELSAAGLSMEQVHLIGFSLGAQIAGIAGKYLKDTEGKPLLRRITGLDPAYPLYPLIDESQRLQRSDAQFVDVVHTDAGVFGYPSPIGHADFYPNGGHSFQPGCSPKQIFVYLKKNFEVFVSCSHQRAWRLYADSVRYPESYPATKCHRWKGMMAPCAFTVHSYMGLGANPSAVGKFYLETKNSVPYGKGLNIR